MGHLSKTTSVAISIINEDEQKKMLQYGIVLHPNLKLKVNFLPSYKYMIDMIMLSNAVVNIKTEEVLKHRYTPALTPYYDPILANIA